MAETQQLKGHKHACTIGNITPVLMRDLQYKPNMQGRPCTPKRHRPVLPWQNCGACKAGSRGMPRTPAVPEIRKPNRNAPNHTAPNHSKTTHPRKHEGRSSGAQHAPLPRPPAAANVRTGGSGRWVAVLSCMSRLQRVPPGVCMKKARHTAKHPHGLISCQLHLRRCPLTRAVHPPKRLQPLRRS